MVVPGGVKSFFADRQCQLKNTERSIAAAAFSVFAVACPTEALADDPVYDCSPLDPRIQLTQRSEEKARAGAKTLYKIVDIGGNVERNMSQVTQNLADVPTSEQANVKYRLLYLFCQMMSRDNIDKDKKAELYMAMLDRLLPAEPSPGPPPKAVGSPPAPAPAPTTATAPATASAPPIAPASAPAPASATKLTSADVCTPEARAARAARPKREGDDLREAMCILQGIKLKPDKQK
jgi:hypothetical protein